MTITNGYATLAEFKSWVTVRGSSTSTDANDDAVIETIVEAVSREIDRLCGRHFYSVSTTRYYKAEEMDILYCDDIASTSGLTIYTDNGGDGTYENIWASTDYSVEPSNNVGGWPFLWIERTINGSYYFPIGIQRGVKITATFGWSAVPTDIKMDCLAIAHNVWMDRSGQVSNGKVSVTAGGVVIRPESIPDHVMQNLLTYRRLV